MLGAMVFATAEAVATISIAPFSSGYMSNPDVLERYIRRFLPPACHDVVIIPETTIRAVGPATAIWLESVRQRITDSIKPINRAIEPKGHWLDQEIADAALIFFTHNSDVLPGEPFIYSSRTGDLVCEYETANGRLTTVISKSHLIAFAVMGEVVREKHLELGPTISPTLRHELQKLTEMLLTGPVHGAKVESEN